MSYEFALETAGANVIQYQAFGSYQGQWFALVEWNGKKGFVVGSYGSCSSCDSFQNEFGWHEHKHFENETYDPFYEEAFNAGCESCVKEKTRLVKFGESYLEDMLTYDEAMKKAKENDDWDEEAKHMIEWVNGVWKANDLGS